MGARAEIPRFVLDSAQHSLSYPDAFAVVLAQSREATILTGDAEFQRVVNKVKIEWLPRK